MNGYFRPETLDRALEILIAEPCRIAAGCTDLLPATSRQKLDGPVLDITNIDAVRGIEFLSDHVRIGAATSWSALAKAALPAAFDGIKSAALEVGSIQIQNAGTLGGNLCNASPAADGVPCLLTLDAEVELVSRDGLRVLPLNQFILGPRKTDLQKGELLSAVLIPNRSLAGQGRFIKLGARKYLVISIAMAASRIVVEAGTIRDIAVAVGACSAVATRLLALEQNLVGRALADLPRDLEALIEPELAPITDSRGDAAYRRNAAPELVARLLAA